MLTIVAEEVATRLIDLGDAISLMEDALAILDRGEAELFPVTRGHGSDSGTRFGIKAAYDAIHRLPGLKIGTYWPGNAASGRAAHGSTTLFLDDENGLPTALVSATYLTALRTAAVEAVAVSHLARQDAGTLALFGTGHQAYYQALAIARVRTLRRVLVVGRNRVRADALCARLEQGGLAAEPAAAADAIAAAEMISTVTAAREPLFDAALVRAGTHVSAMGADGPGKQELPVELVSGRGARLFADVAAQALTIGEYQHAATAGLIGAEQVTTLGAVVTGRMPGRRDDHEITIFDSSGFALQDLLICNEALARARAEGSAVEVDFQ